MTTSEETTERYIRKVENMVKCNSNSSQKSSNIYSQLKDEIGLMEDRMDHRMEKKVHECKIESEKKIQWLTKSATSLVFLFSGAVGWLFMTVIGNQNAITSFQSEIKAEIRRIDSTYITYDLLYNQVRNVVKEAIQPLIDDIKELKNAEQK